MTVFQAEMTCCDSMTFNHVISLTVESVLCIFLVCSMFMASLLWLFVVTPENPTVSAYSGVGTLIVIYATKLITGGIRVEAEDEIAGLDNSLHGERAFEID